MSIQVIRAALLSEDFSSKASASVYRAFAKVLDEDETLDDLEAVQKTCIGINFEKQFLKSMVLPAQAGKATKHLGLKHDTRVAGYDLDIKFTVGKNWMIGPECESAFCLLAQADYPKQVFSIGLFHAAPENLSNGTNRDRKRTVSKEGKKTIDWLLVDQPIKP